MNNTTLKFFVAADPTFARETVPAVIQNAHHRFKELGAFSGGDEKTIYLPADETFPFAPRLVITDRGVHEEITLFTDRPVKKGSTRTRPDNCTLDPLAMEVMIGHARALTRRKILPAFRLWYNNFQGIEDGRAIFVLCESVTEAPAGLTGSYVSLTTAGKPAEATAWLKRQLVAYVGAREVREVTDSFDAMLRGSEPRFPWTLTRKTK